METERKRTDERAGPGGLTARGRRRVGALLAVGLGLGCLSIAPAATPAAASAASMRCGQKLVNTGDSAYEVRASCGEPQATQQRTEYRTYRRLVPVPCGPGSTTTCYRHVVESAEVQVEEWTYDFGPRRFLRFVLFEQGRVVEVKTGGYGAR